MLRENKGTTALEWILVAAIAVLVLGAIVYNLTITGGQLANFTSQRVSLWWDPNVGLGAVGSTATPRPTATAVVAANPGTSSLVSYWPMDETAGTRVDAHSGGNNLSVPNAPGTAAGKVSSAASFASASSQYLSIADNADLSTGDISFTVGAWVYLSNKAANMIAVSKYAGTAPAGLEYSLAYNQAADRFQFSVSDGATVKTVSADTLGAPSAGSWYFITAWHNAGADTVNVNVNNGATDSASTSGIAVQNSSSAFRIGAYGSGDYLNGAVDEAFFYKRLVTDAERAWLYNAGGGRAYTAVATSGDAGNPGTTNLMAYWGLDESGGMRSDAHGSNELMAGSEPYYAAGIQGNAADFESGYSQYLTAASNTSLQMGSSDITFCGWFQFESAASNTLLAKHGATNEYTLRTSASNYPQWLVYTAGGTNFDTFATQINTGSWFFICAWTDKTAGKLYLQVNDGLVYQDAISSANASGSGSFYIGAQSPTTENADARIDEVIFFKGRVLTAAERKWLYNSGAGRTYAELTP